MLKSLELNYHLYYLMDIPQEKRKLLIDYFQDKKILFVRSRDKKDIIGLISQDKKILSDEYFPPPKKREYYHV